MSAGDEATDRCIAVLGAGSWGTALAIQLARNGNAVQLWARDADAVAALAQPFDVLRTLARHPDPAVPADDLLAAALRNLYEAHGGGADGEAVLVDAGRALARLLDDDHERLQSILRRVR